MSQLQRLELTLGGSEEVYGPNTSALLAGPSGLAQLTSLQLTHLAPSCWK